MTALAFQLVGQVDNGQSLKRAFPNANAAAHAEALDHYWFVAFKAYSFDLTSNRRTKTIAYFTTTFWVTFVFV
jgi:hypothetical protein